MGFSSVLVLCIPYSNTLADYSKYLSQIHSFPTLILHYDVPIAECSWSFEKSTAQFTSRIPNTPQTHFFVADLPSSRLQRPIGFNLPPEFYSPSPIVTSDLYSSVVTLSSDLFSSFSRSRSSPTDSFERLDDSIPFDSVYMEQAYLAFSSLLQSLSLSLSTSRRFAAELFFRIQLLNEGEEISPQAIQSACYRSCFMPSARIRSVFHTLWTNLFPSPTISLLHPTFGDDFYIRFQERLTLTESILMVLLAMQFSLHYFEALEDSKLQQMLRDIYKVLHTEVLKILPCTEKLRIDSSLKTLQVVHSLESYGDV